MPRPLTRGPRWTVAEQTRLIDLSEQGWSDARIAVVLGRSRKAVQIRRWQMMAALGGDGRFTVSSLARMMGVGTLPVRRWISRGWLRAGRSGVRAGIGGELRIERADLERFLADRRTWGHWWPEHITDSYWREVACRHRQDRLLTTTEAGRLIGYGSEHVARLVRTGVLEGVRGHGRGGRSRALYVPASSVATYLSAA